MSAENRRAAQFGDAGEDRSRRRVDQEISALARSSDAGEHFEAFLLMFLLKLLIREQLQEAVVFDRVYN